MTGGFLKATRAPFCAAAAEQIVTFGLFAETPAACLVLVEAGPCPCGPCRPPSKAEHARRFPVSGTAQKGLLVGSGSGADGAILILHISR